MKKFSPKKYARLLADLTAGKKKGEIDRILKKFAQFLKKNSALSLVPRILDNYEKIILAGEGKAKLEITSAYKLSAKTRKNLIELAKKQFNEKNLEVEESVNADLTGGFILKSNNRIIDMSLRKSLGDLEKSLKI